ncbi:MAG: paraquat-inducible protein A, partial [Saprospiraceae bacterium]|nr:paraquat-inducible protein A [Saprospiraceae bacterium]
GFFRSSVAGLTGMFNQIRKEVPRFTDQILDFMDDPANRDGVRNYVMSKITDYTDRTFAEIDYTRFNAVIARHGQPDRPSTVAHIQHQLADIAWRVRPLAIGLLVLIALFSLTTLAGRRLQRPEFLLLTLICVVLLVGGVMLPMIDIDARIAEIQFTLLGETVAFHDQVLFYKSKSILEVTQLMITQGELDLLAVGILILSFSVLFPFSKLAASLVYLYRSGSRDRRLIRFLVFKTGKWSMADVMVVAIFMAFIGFQGIVSEQLRQIQNFASNVEIVGTNQSSLQFGFYLFTAFALISLLIAHRLQYSFKHEQAAVPSNPAS